MAATGTTVASLTVSTRSRTLTNWLGNRLSSLLSKMARSLTVPVLMSITLSVGASPPHLLARDRAVGDQIVVGRHVGLRRLLQRLLRLHRPRRRLKGPLRGAGLDHGPEAALLHRRGVRVLELGELTAELGLDVGGGDRRH